MEVPEIVSKLREFGEAESVRAEKGKVVFHLKCEIGSLARLEEMTETIDNLHPDNVELTGSRKRALVIIEMDSDDFSQIPPYLYKNWKDSDIEDGY